MSIKVYDRCALCDYCELSSDTKSNITFTVDSKTKEVLCSECTISISEVLHEYSQEEDKKEGQMATLSIETGEEVTITDLDDLELQQLLVEFGLDHDYEK